MDLRKPTILGLTAIVTACATAPKEFDTTWLHPRVQSAARYLYENSDNEWVLCLGGQVAQDTLWVDRAELPLTHQTSPTNVSYTRCDNDRYVGTLHPHYTGQAAPSPIDINFWQTDSEARVHMIMVEDSITVWRRRK